MTIDAIATIIDTRYTKADLEASFKGLVRIFIEHHYDFLKQEVPHNILTLADKKDYKKDELAKLVAICFKSKTVFQKFREILIPDVQKVLDELIWCERLSQEQIEELTDVKIYADKKKEGYGGQTYHRRELKIEFKLFSSIYSGNSWSPYTTQSFSLYLAPELRKLIARYYDKPPQAKLSALAELPTGIQQTYLNSEFNILTELMRTIAYVQQGNIRVTKKGRPIANSSGKMQRKLNLQEFYPNTNQKALKNLRTKLLMGLFVRLSSKQTQGDRLDILKKEIFERIFLKNFESTPIILQHLKGMGYMDDHEFQNPEVIFFKRILPNLPVDQWIGIENLRAFIRYNILDIRPILEHRLNYKLYYDYEDPDSYRGEHFVNSSNYHSAIVDSFLTGSCFFFAAFGLLKLAYNEPNTSTLGKTALSPYDGLQYIQLTPLGSYILGQTSVYVSPKGIDGSNILLSSDSLTIVIDEKDTNAPSLLEPYAERVSNTRYRTDFSFFLKQCRSKQELEDKIKLFQQFVSNELPSNWEQFFNELRQKIDPLEAVEDIKIFKIPEDNSSLIRLIARDEVLRKLSTKAEGYHVLISKANLSRFKKRLQEFGYFMTS